MISFNSVSGVAALQVNAVLTTNYVDVDFTIKYVKAVDCPKIPTNSTPNPSDPNFRGGVGSGTVYVKSIIHKL